MKATWTFHSTTGSSTCKSGMHVLTIEDRFNSLFSYSGSTKAIAIRKAKKNVIKDVGKEMIRLGRVMAVVEKL